MLKYCSRWFSLFRIVKKIFTKKYEQNVCWATINVTPLQNIKKKLKVDCSSKALDATHMNHNCNSDVMETSFSQDIDDMCVGQHDF